MPDIMSGELHVPTIEPDPRSEWLQKRRVGIGGSEAPIIMGCGYKSEFELWADKCHLLEETEEEREEWFWGNELEGPLARRYVQKTGRTLIDHGRFAIVFSEKHPFMHCTLDREIPSALTAIDEIPKDFLLQGPGALSIKNAGWYMASEWEVEPPTAFQIQLQHELSVHDWLWGSFAVLIGGNRFRWCDVPRNERFISLMIEREEEFMDRVRRQDPPDPDASNSARETILRLHPKDNGKSVVLPAESYYWSQMLRSAKAAKKEAEADVLQYQNLLESRIGDATLGLFPDIPVEWLADLPEAHSRAILEHPKEIIGHTWKHQSRAGYTVEPGDYRVMREEKAKVRRGRR